MIYIKLFTASRRFAINEQTIWVDWMERMTSNDCYFSPYHEKTILKRDFSLCCSNHWTHINCSNHWPVKLLWMYCFVDLLVSRNRLKTGFYICKSLRCYYLWLKGTHKKPFNWATKNFNGSLVYKNNIYTQTHFWVTCMKYHPCYY